ncbi:hypothetical protein [Lysinibacillus sp. RC79]|uniref:hypothetical protein n=1 Tax=Lysinibacillus sp. RC79 TaxID=3156296 RepID=UPI00351440F8
MKVDIDIFRKLVDKLKKLGDKTIKLVDKQSKVLDKSQNCFDKTLIPGKPHTFAAENLRLPLRSAALSLQR